MKSLMIFLGVVLVGAVAFFWRDVLGVFAGMSVLEAMKTIVTFILHVTVATLAGYALMLVPDYVAPWMKVFRWKQRQAWKARRRGIVVPTAQPKSVLPRINKDQVLAWMVSQMAGTSPKRRTRLGEEVQEEPTIRLDL